MSLRPQTVPSVPEDAARIARAAFPKGNLYMRIRDEIGILLTDADIRRFISSSRTTRLRPVAIGFGYHFPVD